MSETAYQVIIGLEVHVQLRTKTKLFCRCSTEFGAPPNTQTCPVCTGTPGALPVLNRRAFELSVQTAVALDCEIPQLTKWDRKNYYYPDLPKGYQISQFDLPLSQNGHLDIVDPESSQTRRIGITRAHLEEDAGKSMHDEVAGKADSRIDLNRTGTPLLEIVSEPDLRSAAQAKVYLTELKLLLTYLGVSDCNMQEGSLRVDANVNLHLPVGDQTVATPIVEIKNMNSFRAVERALHYEAGRQYRVWQETKQTINDVPKQTRGWDDQAEKTFGQRHKEESSDYRYFPDPDLVPVLVSAEQVAEVRASLAELPVALRGRLESTYDISAYDADVIVNQGRALADYFIATAEACGSGKQASNWIQQDILRTLNDEQIEIADYPVSALQLAELIDAVNQRRVDNTRAKDVLQEMQSSRTDASTAMKALGIEQVDESDLEALCKTLVEGNPGIADDVRNGKMQAVGALIGQAKKQNPNVNPGRVREICLSIITGESVG